MVKAAYIQVAIAIGCLIILVDGSFYVIVSARGEEGGYVLKISREAYCTKKTHA